MSQESNQNRKKDIPSDHKVISVVGLGTIGLPLAQEFARVNRVIGYDNDRDKIKDLTEENNLQNLFVTDNPDYLKEADFIMITVPTPIDANHNPNLNYLKEATLTVSKYLKKGCIVIIESTVYPGATEEIVKPILEQSGLKCGVDFKLASSPERVNPGDDEHTLDKITKVVGGMDKETTDTVTALYEKIVKKVHRVKDIRTAEATKLVENIQRDVNIALINELSIIFRALELDTEQILDAAATKWNFHRYTPGLVGGYCIPVAPHYMLFKAKTTGYKSKIITAAREINDYMPAYIAELVSNNIKKTDRGEKPKILIMGLAYKEDISDSRCSSVENVIKKLVELDFQVYGYDPVLQNTRSEFGIELIEDLYSLKDIAGIIVTVAHRIFADLSLYKLKTVTNNNPVIIDIRGLFNEDEAKVTGFNYIRL